MFHVGQKVRVKDSHWGKFLDDRPKSQTGKIVQCNTPDKIHPLTLLVVEHEDGQRINWLARSLEILQEPEMKEILALLPKHQQQMVCHAAEWIAEGWGLEGDPTPEQIVAALLMEANTQDAMVKTGDSHASYPQELRQLAYNILSYCQPKMFSRFFADEMFQDQGNRT